MSLQFLTLAHGMKVGSSLSTKCSLYNVLGWIVGNVACLQIPTPHHCLLTYEEVRYMLQVGYFIEYLDGKQEHTCSQPFADYQVLWGFRGKCILEQEESILFESIQVHIKCLCIRVPNRHRLRACGSIGSRITCQDCIGRVSTYLFLGNRVPVFCKQSMCIHHENVFVSVTRIHRKTRLPQ